MLSYNLDLKPLGSCKSEPLKKLKSSRLQMFCKIGSTKKSAIFTGKHLCWGLFLIKLQTPTQTPTEVFPVDIAKFLRIVFLYNTSGGCNSFLIQNLWWLLLTVLPQYSKVSWGACFLISHLHVHSILIKSFHETLRK